MWYNGDMVFSKSFQILFAGAALGTAVLLTDCEQKDSPPPTEIVQAVNQMLNESVDNYMDDADLAALIKDFIATGNVKHTTQDGTTMLHLACAAGNNRLLTHLLQNGADPNAISKRFGAPIVCFFDIPRDMSAETKLMLNLLIANHLKIADYSIFRDVENLDEDTYIYLLDKTWDNKTGHQAGLVPALRGWSKAFRAVLDKAKSPLPAEYEELMNVLATYDRCGSKKQYTDCAHLLLSKGSSVEQADIYGTAPLMNAAKAALTPLSNGEIENRPSDLLLILLENKGDVYRISPKDPVYPGFCAYDLLMGNPWLMENLTAQGYHFDAPPLDFKADDSLITTILRADMRQEPEESLRHGFGQIATMLNPDDELKANPSYRHSLNCALKLLMRADEVQGAAAIAAMPLWDDATFWATNQEESLEILETIHSNGIQLPPGMLVNLARKTEAAGALRVAEELMELLAFSTISAEDLNRLANDDSHPVLQAGAWQAILLQKGLPAAKSYKVEQWLYAKGQQKPKTEEMKRALRLTSLKTFTDGKMSRDEQELLFKDMEIIGDPESAALCREEASNPLFPYQKSKGPEVYVRCTCRLAVATAKYFVKHAEIFGAIPKTEEESEEHE